MSKIVLDVDNKNMDTVLTILNSLKTGLIKNISTDKKMQAKPTNSIKKIVLEDEFMSKPTASKYLSSAGYKEKLQNNKK